MSLLEKQIILKGLKGKQTVTAMFDTLSEDFIIGAATMQKWKIRLDFDTEYVLYDKKMHRLRI